MGQELSTFQDRRKSHKRFGICGRKAIRAFRDRRHASSLESAGQKLDVLRFITRDLFQICIERVGEAGFFEVILRVVGKTLAVELIFKMLECECIIEDITCTEA